MSWHKNNKIIGQIGENLAAEYLAERGYRVLDRNWSTKWGELDIVAQKEGVMVYVEVKTKVGEGFGTPEDMVNSYKIRQVRQTAEVYRITHNLPEGQARIDVIAIVLDKDHQVVRLEQYENVF